MVPQNLSSADTIKSNHDENIDSNKERQVLYLAVQCKSNWESVTHRTSSESNRTSILLLNRTSVPELMERIKLEIKTHEKQRNRRSMTESEMHITF